MEQQEVQQVEQNKVDGRTVHAENVRLKKYINELETELERLRKFVGGSL